MKKRIPLAILQQIQPIISKHRDLIRIIQDEKSMFSLEDAEVGTGFFFKAGFPDTDKNGMFLIEYAPLSDQHNQTDRANTNLEYLLPKLERWFAILANYAVTPDLDDDPKLRYYQAEFADYFTIHDEDADEAPLDLPHQLHLNEYLEQMEEKLAQRAETASPAQQEQLLLIEQECASLRETMGDMTKNQTANKLASIMAKARKFSIGLVKEFFTEFKKEAYKQIAKGILEIDLPAMGDVLGSIGQSMQ